MCAMAGASAMLCSQFMPACAFLKTWTLSDLSNQMLFPSPCNRYLPLSLSPDGSRSFMLTKNVAFSMASRLSLLTPARKYLFLIRAQVGLSRDVRAARDVSASVGVCCSASFIIHSIWCSRVVGKSI
uniref:Secreted protein n=1 Tax=Ixodes ricinus TaxID=34613 RepID=A0A6B0UR53_IXORI